MSVGVHCLVVWSMRGTTRDARAPMDVTTSTFEWIELAPAIDEADSVTPSIEPPAIDEATATDTPSPWRAHATRATRAESTETAHMDDAAPSENPIANAPSPDDSTGASGARVTTEASVAERVAHATDAGVSAQTPSRAPDLSARAAARSVVPIESAPSVADEAQARLNAELSHAGNHKSYLSELPPPTLQRMADGSYVHAAPGFFATIHPDGRVTFRDKPPVEAHLSFTPLTFDLYDMMLRAMGEELYPAHKRWFMEQTAELRAQLEADDRLHWFARARQALLDRLQEIVRDPKRSLSAKRDAVFALWLDCADDEVGARGREVIEAFVRERFPQGSAHAFTSSELSRMNQRNAALRRFDPYTSSTATRSAPAR